MDDHVAHARAFAAAIEPPRRAVDLGSGAGLPGLVLATGPWRATQWVLLDVSQRRCALLEEAVAALGLTDRVAVRRARAEEAGRAPDLRSAFDAVVSRAFGTPAVTAECAAPLLRPGGALVVSEPPDADPGRWPAAGLAELGMTDEGRVGGGIALRRIRQTTPVPERYPRRVGIPAKRPLW